MKQLLLFYGAHFNGKIFPVLCTRKTNLEVGWMSKKNLLMHVSNNETVITYLVAKIWSNILKTN